MNDLPPQAIQILYPVLVIIALVVVGAVGLVGGLWAGFRWLKGQIRETSTEMLTPLAERLALVEKSATRAHERIDEFMGPRP